MELQFSEEAGGQYLNIAVTDTGIGILENTQQLIFEALQQADGAAN